MNLREAAEMALEFASWFTRNDHSIRPKHKAPEVVEALRQALAQPEQEPVAIVNEGMGGIEWLDKPLPDDTPLYTAPPKRKWVGLTDEDLKPLCDEWRIMYGGYVDDFAKAIEAKLKEKNT